MGFAVLQRGNPAPASLSEQLQTAVLELGEKQAHLATRGGLHGEFTYFPGVKWAQALTELNFLLAKVS